ncbi:MAG: hypothetical protein Q7I98_02620, partial [Erysipelotrichaceae bacterium]|nr:hypothetical protein [Erysipelotrichaceae bacterium]
KDWRDKMQPVINQLKENMDKIIAGTFLKSTAEVNVKSTAEANNDNLFINAATRKDIPNTLQYLEAEYKKKQASEANVGVESSASKLGKILEGHYTPERLKGIEQKAIKEKIGLEDVATPKSAKEGIKEFEEKIKKYSAPKPKPRQI